MITKTLNRWKHITKSELAKRLAYEKQFLQIPIQILRS